MSKVFTLFLSLCLFSTLTFAGSAEEGKKAFAAKGCIGCHGPAGKSPNPSAFPTLAGKEAAYIKEQLIAFKTQKRNNPLMSPMAAGLTDADIDNIAAYIGSVK